MKKLLIVSFYDVIEYFLSIKEGFSSQYYTVYNYPLFKFAYDTYDKIKDYDKHFNKYLKEVEPDVVLWCFIDVPTEVFEYIKQQNKNITFVMFNFDEPMNMSDQLLKKASFFDLVVTTTKQNLVKYKLYSGVKDILYNPFGYDEKFFFPMNNQLIEENIEYECDISMNCFNLLLDTAYYNAQYINRVELINSIIKYCDKNNKTFKLYGSLAMKEMYPKNYGGEIPYIKKNAVYNLSKINISTHCFSDSSFYLNEEIFSILGSGGLLFVDKVKDIEKILSDGTNCIFLDKNNYISQIDAILKNYDNNDVISEIKHNAVEIAKKYSWKQWVTNLNTMLCKKFFDPVVYQQVNELDDTDATYDHWLNNKCKLCFKPNIPAQFNNIEYAKKYNLDEKKIYLVYYHWYMNGKNDLYLEEKKNSMEFNPDKLHVTMPNFMKLCNIFNKVDVDTDVCLEKIQKFSESRPYCDLNELLKTYYNLCY